MSDISAFSEELNKLKVITSKLTENGYLVDRAAQWEFAFDAIPDLVLIVNHKLKVKFINESLANKLSIEKSDAINLHCYEIINCPKCEDESKFCLLNQEANSDSKNEEVYINRLKGWFNFTHSPIYNDDGDLLGFICVLRDISKRKEIEKALMASEQRFRAMFDSAKDSIFIKNTELKYVLVNPAMEKLFGKNSGELIGLSDRDIFDEEIAESIIEIDKRVLSGETIEEEVAKPVEGKIRHFNTVKVPLKDEEGRIVAIWGSARDITSRKEIEEALKKSEEKYRNICETAPLAFVVSDSNYKVLEWNKNAEMIFGYTKEEIQDKNFFDYIVPASAKEQVKRVFHLLKSGQHIANINENLTKDGNIIVCEWYNSVYHNCQGEPVGFISLATDITEIKEKESLAASIFEPTLTGETNYFYSY